MRKGKDFLVNPSLTLRDNSPNQTAKSKRGNKTPVISRNGSYLYNTTPDSPPKDTVYLPNKSFVLHQLHNRYEKKYPSYQIQKHLNYKLTREGVSLNSSQVFETEEEQHLLQSLRKERNARQLVNVKPTHSPGIGPVLVNRYVKEMKLDKQKSMYSNKKHKSSLHSFDEYDSPQEDIRNSLIFPVEYHTTKKQNLDSSLPYLLRIGDVNNGAKDSNKVIHVQKTVNRTVSKGSLKGESKNVLDKPGQEESEKNKDLIGETEKSCGQTENTQPDNAVFDKVTTFKLLYQKFKNPSNRKNITNPDISLQKDADLNNSSMFVRRTHFSPIREERQNSTDKKVRFRTKKIDPNKPSRSPSEDSPMNHSFLGTKHKMIKRRMEPLDELKKGFTLIEQEAKDLQKGLIEDKSEHKLKALAGEVNRAYKDFDKGITSKKAGQYNFPAFVKSLLQKSKHAARSITAV